VRAAGGGSDAPMSGARWSVSTTPTSSEKLECSLYESGGAIRPHPILDHTENRYRNRNWHSRMARPPSSGAAPPASLAPGGKVIQALPYIFP
jgi:hypothetical protein